MAATVEANTQEEEEDDWSCQEGNSQQTLLPCRGLHSVVGVGKPARVSGDTRVLGDRPRSREPDKRATSIPGLEVPCGSWLGDTRWLCVCVFMYVCLSQSLGQSSPVLISIGGRGLEYAVSFHLLACGGGEQAGEGKDGGGGVIKYPAGLTASGRHAPSVL